MKRHRVHFFLLTAALCSGAALVATARGPKRADDAPTTITIQAQPGVDIEALALEYGLVVRESLPEKQLYTLELPFGTDESVLAQTLLSDGRVSFAEAEDEVNAPENGMVQGSPVHVPFDFLRAPDLNYCSIAAGGSVNQSVYRQIHLGTTHTATKGAGVIVAVLDTGVLASQTHLESRLLDGYDALDPATPPDEEDPNAGPAWGHGTMVAGVIARLAPDAKILPVRVLDAQGKGSLLGLVRGLDWAVAHGAKVVNLSLGTPIHSDILEEAIEEAREAGVLVVAAAGNAGSERRNYPASYGEALCVAALEADNTKSPYSNYGEQVSLCAPGTGIRSTYADGSYAAWSGTSFATPLVSAAAALVRSAHPTFGPGKTAERLVETARSVNRRNPGMSGKLGRGLLDIEKAVREGDD